MTIAMAPSTVGAKSAWRPKSRLATFTLIPVEDEAAEVALRIEDLHSSFPPDGAFQESLVRQVAVISMRLDRLVWHEWRLLSYAAKRAELVWDEDRELAAVELAARLPKKPERVAKALEESLHGLKWMIGRWEYLEKMAQGKGPWNDAQRSLALDLLGQPSDFREVVFVFDGDAALQAAIARQQIHRLQQLIPNQVQLDARQRDLTLQGLSPFASPALRSARRTEAQSARHLHRSSKCSTNGGSTRPRPTPPCLNRQNPPPPRRT